MSARQRCITILCLLLTGQSFAAVSHGASSESVQESPVWLLLDPGACNEALDAERLHTACLERRLTRLRSQPDPKLDLGPDSELLERIQAAGAELRVASRWLDAVSVVADAQVLESLLAMPEVLGLRPVANFDAEQPMVTSHSEHQGSRLEYGTSAGQLEMLRVPEAHDLGLSGAGVRVLMLDTGYYKEHVALDSNRIVAEWDFINQDGNTQNEGDDLDGQHRHGTATATALGGYWPGTLYGPAYACEFLLAKTEDTASETPVEEDYYVAALEWGEALGADVVSSSLGYTAWYTWEDMDGESSLVAQAVNAAVSLGVTCVNSAGNYRDDDWGHIGSPADAFGVISVGAVHPDETLTSFSSPGPSFDGRLKPEVSAQGYSVAAAGFSDPEDLRYFAGTSLSCPLVAGCAALLLEANPEWGPSEVRYALMSTADRAANPDNDFGWGIVDVVQALDAVPQISPLQIASSGSSVVLSWPATPYQQIHIYSSSTPYGDFLHVASTHAASWTDEGARVEQQMFYQIRGE